MYFSIFISHLSCCLISFNQSIAFSKLNYLLKQSTHTQIRINHQCQLKQFSQSKHTVKSLSRSGNSALPAPCRLTLYTLSVTRPLAKATRILITTPQISFTRLEVNVNGIFDLNSFGSFTHHYDCESHPTVVCSIHSHCGSLFHCIKTFHMIYCTFM